MVVRSTATPLAETTSGLVIHDEDLLCHYPPVSIKPTPLALGRGHMTDGIDHFQLHQPVCQEPLCLALAA